MSSLDSVPVGKKARVVAVNGQGALRRRIMDMGITKGVEIEVYRVAPLGDPLELKLRGYQMSIRKGDAQMIEIEG